MPVIINNSNGGIPGMPMPCGCCNVNEYVEKVREAGGTFNLLDPVSSKDDIVETYPTPNTGDMVFVLDDMMWYLWDGESWERLEIDPTTDEAIDAANSNRHAAETAARKAADDQLQANIDAEAAARKAADDAEAAARKAADDAEAAARKAADDAEAKARANADTTLQNNINAEATTRADADTALGNRITTETNERKAADTTLENSITTETNERKAADTTLENRVTVLEENEVLSGTYTTTDSAHYLEIGNFLIQWGARLVAASEIINSTIPFSSSVTSRDSTELGPLITLPKSYANTRYCLYVGKNAWQSYLYLTSTASDGTTTTINPTSYNGETLQFFMYDRLMTGIPITEQTFRVCYHSSPYDVGKANHVLVWQAIGLKAAE